MAQARSDSAHFRYRSYKWGRLGQIFRGPKPDLTRPYVACIGSGQTFGRYAFEPYPQILETRLQTQVANFGVCGAGPGLFLRDSMILEAASNADLCVVQAMSARALSNRLFKVKPESNAQIKGVAEQLRSLFPTIDFDGFTHTKQLIDHLAHADPVRFGDVLEELKTAWTARMKLLLDSIQSKTILLWLSTREPGRDAPGVALGDLPFPHFVDEAMFNSVAAHADFAIKCVSDEGLPQTLLVDGEAVFEKPDGTPMLENALYPSPEMHQAAARALEPKIRSMLRIADSEAL